MKEIMLSDMPVEQRCQVLKDSCDSISEGRYLVKFTQEDKNDERQRLKDVSMEIAAIEDEFSVVKSEYKAKLKPLIEERASTLENLKAGGIYQTGEIYKFIDSENAEVGFYDPSGHLIEERGLTKEERQRTMFQSLRTGTNN